MTSDPNQDESISPSLGLWDGVSIIIGIVVGVGIFRTPFMVFGNVSGPWYGLGAWALGGLLALIGALCYAELATTYPRSGGDYVYLTRAYGRWVGFLFGWAQLAVILTGSIGVMAFAFSDYAINLWDLDPSVQLRQRAETVQDEGEAAKLRAEAADVHQRVARTWGFGLTVAPILILTLMNLFGVILGKLTQNALTIAKVLGLGGIVAAGMIWGEPFLSTPSTPLDGQSLSFGFAMIMVLYAYGGWNDAAFVAAEVRDRRRNIPRVLILGTGGVMLLYLLVNVAYLWGLGFEGLRNSTTPAADVIEQALGRWGSKGMSLLVMVSALGAVNGLIFTGSRVYSTMGSDHGIFALLSRWHPRLGSPVWSLTAQAVFALSLTVTVGTSTGRHGLDKVAILVSKHPIPWEQYGGGFDTLVAGTAPVFWLFFLLTGLSVFALRERDREAKRPFSAPLYPFTPFVFCVMCVYMLYSSLAYAKALALLGIVPLLVGLPLFWISRAMAPRGAIATGELRGKG